MGAKEDSLRRRIKGVLESFKNDERYGIIRVTDIHSTTEYGMDLTFEQKDVFGKAHLYGIQIKTRDIKLSVGGESEALKEIVTQLAVGFGHTFKPQGQHLDAAFIVTSGEINQHAEEYISSARIGFREIHFIDGQQLRKFFSDKESLSKTLEET